MKAFCVRVILGALAITACHSPTSEIRPDPACDVPAGVPIRVTPTDTSVQAGDTVRFKAILSDNPCYSRLLAQGVRWVSLDSAVAVVDSATGLARTRAAGGVFIEALPVTDAVLGSGGRMTVTLTR